MAFRRLAIAALVLAGAARAQPHASVGTDPVTVVVLGSSNAEGYGTSHPDSAWASRLERSLPTGSQVVNLARGGYTTFHLLPTGADTPDGRATPDPARNITAALAHEPDAVVISLTSNDAAREVPLETQLANYAVLLDAAGDVPVYVTTPSPRTEAISPRGREIQEALRAATLDTFERPIDIWALLATADGEAIPRYSAGDGIHYNDAAHARIAEGVGAALARLRAVPPHPVWTLSDDARSAAWVAPADLAPADSQNVWAAYRTRFDLGAVPEEAIARIAVDSKYWLWVNGRLVVREGALKRGPRRKATYLDRVDLAPYLVPGENVVAVLVWTWGKPGFSHNDPGAPGLLFDLVAEGRAVDLAWRARRHRAYGDTGPPHPNYRLPESNVRFDARRALSGWTTRGYLDRLWPEAVFVAEGREGPWGALVERPVPQWRDVGLRSYTEAPAFPFVATGDTVVVPLPYNAQVTPWLDVTAPAGVTIEMRTDAYIDGNGRTVRAEYVTRPGRQAFEAPGWMHGHAVRYAIPAGVTVHGLRYRETGYATRFAGSFASSDPALDTLWQKAARTLYVTMRDTYMDTPGRERAQWWGDVVLEMGEAFYALDRRSDALARKGILELAAWQRPDSTLYSPIPSDPSIWSAELPTQMLASVGWYGFWTYYQHSGDLDTIRRVYPAVRDYLALWEQDARGLVVPRAGGWTWGDWGNDKDMPLIFNGWYALALQGQRAMAEALGYSADLPVLDAKLDRLTDAFDATFWTGTAYRSPGHEGATDDRGHALAVLAGLAPPERHPAIRDVLVAERHASPYFEKYVAEALIRMGHVDDALARLRARYAAMIASPLTTLWEGWELNSATYGGGTANHAWSGGPLTLFSSLVAGVEPIEPGYATFRVHPRLGSLDSVRAVVPSVRGEIVAHARQDGGSLRLEVTVPDGTRALVALPGDRLRLDGETLWTAEGGPRPHAPAEVEAVEAGRVHVWVGPGTWTFEAD